MIDASGLRVVTAVAAVLLFAACLRRGQQQRREGGASLGRLVVASLALTVLGLAPLLAVQVCGFDDWVFAQILGREGHAEGPLPLDLIVVVVATIMAIKIVLGALKPVGRYFARGEDLPPADDPALLQRIAELARQIGAATPRVVLRGSAGPQLAALAAAGGVVAPTLVVSDGVLHRLSAPERDAILAHELAHVAKHTVWKYVILMCASQLAAVLIATQTSAFIGLVLCVVLIWGAVKIAGHFEEPACDVRAARAVGFATMASALDKIHAGNLIEQDGALTGWVHATQTHPSMAVRLSELHAAAPDAERVSIVYDACVARAHRRVSRIVLLGWIAAIGAAVWLGARPDLMWWGFGLLLLVVLLPPLLLLAPHVGDWFQAYRLRVIRLPHGLVIRLVSIVVAIAMVLNMFAFKGLGIEPIWVIVAAGLIVLGTAMAGRRQRRVVAKMYVAYGAQDFERALELLDQLPPHAARRPAHRIDRAVAHAAAGRLDAAVAELEQLIVDVPKEHAGKLVLARLVAPTDPARALALADEVDAAVPDSHHVTVFRAAALRRLGQTDTAEELIQRALARKPRQGGYHALAARIALSAGDLERAAERLERAEKLMPGDALVRLVRAELAHARGDEEAAEAITAAREAIAHQPLAFLAPDLRELEERCGAATKTGVR